MKIIPGFGTLIYMACTDKPELGWDENGFANFTDLSAVPNLPGKPEQLGQHPAAPPTQTNPQPSTATSPRLSLALPVTISTGVEPQVQFQIPANAP